jgi:hypothetical protein
MASFFAEKHIAARARGRDCQINATGAGHKPARKLIFFRIFHR